MNPLPCGLSQAASARGLPASGAALTGSSAGGCVSVQPRESLGEVREGGELSKRWQPWWSLEQDREPDSKACAKWTPTFVELGSGVLLVCQSSGRTSADGLLSCPPHLGPGPGSACSLGSLGRGGQVREGGSLGSGMRQASGAPGSSHPVIEGNPREQTGEG